MKISYRMKDARFAPALSDVRLGGYPGQKAETFFARRVRSGERDAIFAEAEGAFANPVDDQTLVGYWQGEFWGKLAISAARVCRYSGDEELKEFLRGSARRVLACQRENGYLGTYRNEDFVCSPDVNETEKLLGWKCNWCWNIWCRKYTLWGLLELYDLLGDEAILTGAARLADHLIAQLSRLGLRLGQTGTFNGLPSGSILKPMLILYRVTGDERYLTFCVNVAEDWDRPDNAMPNLIANARTGKSVHEWYPDSEKWAKAYEMMSCLDGLIELYRVTGTAKYLETAAAIRDRLEESERNVLYSVGYNDVFAHAAAELNGITEPCDVVHWMRLNYELYCVTGENRYLDSFERAYLNAFLASSFRDGGWSARCVRSSGRTMIARQCGFTRNHCCTDNLPRGYMNAAQASVMAGDEGIYVNLYTELTAKIALPGGGCARVEIGGGYVRDGRVELTVQTDTDTSLLLRVPVWSKTATFAVCGKTYTAGAEETCRIPLSKGETKVQAAFDCEPRLVAFAGEVERHAPDDWRVKRWCNLASEPFGARGDVPADYMNWTRLCTLQKGPLLYAMSKRVGSTEEAMFGKGAVSPESPVTLSPMEQDGTWLAWRVRIDDFETTVCDYASASDEIQDDPAYFSIWL